MAEYDDIIRVGIVSSVHPEKHRVRVRFADKDDLTSYELPMIVRGSLKNKMQHLPDPGEGCFMRIPSERGGTGLLSGILYSRRILPIPPTKKNIFEDPGRRLHFCPQNQQDHSNDRQLRIKNDMGRRGYHL